MKISDNKYGVLISTPGLIIIIALIIFPVIALFVTSFLRYTAVYPISFTGLGNFRYIFNNRLFWVALQKTFIYSLGATGLAFCGGMAIALALSKITRGSTIFRSLAMFPWAVPLVISGLIWKWIFSPDVGIFNHFMLQLGLIDTPLSIYSNPNLAMIGCIIADAWVRTPFMIIFTLAGIDSVPQELYEAARIDGADSIDCFRFITLPLIKGMVLVGLLITTMFSFRTIDVIFSMTEGGPGKGTYVLGLFIIDQIWRRVDYGSGSAAGLIVFVLIFVIASFYIYQLIKKN